MRVLGPLLGMLASAVTIFAAIVRLWWSKPKQRTSAWDGEPYTVEPKAQPWLATAAKWWLIIVVGGGTIILLVIVAVTIIQMST